MVPVAPEFYREVTGAHGDRREPPKMLAALDPGDVVKMTQSWASRPVPSISLVAGRLVFSQD